MFIKRLIATVAVAVAGSVAFLAPQAAQAATATSAPQPVTVTTADAPSSMAGQSSSPAEWLNNRVATDTVFAADLRTAAAQGDTETISRLLAAEGVDIQGVSVDRDAQTNVVVGVRVTVCFRARFWNAVYCSTITITVEL